MLRTTDVAIVAVPVVACLALFAGLGLLNRPAAMGALPLPSLQGTASTEAATANTTSPAAQSAVTLPETATSTTPAPEATDTVTASPPTAAPAAPTPPATIPATPESATLTRGRELAALLYSQRLASLWGTFTPAVRQEWGTFQKFQAYRVGGLKAFGAERKVVSEQVRQSGGVQYYTRTARFERGPQHDWTLVFGLNSARQVVAFNIVNAGVLPATPAQ